jgi:nitric oxide dioxygenase
MDIQRADLVEMSFRTIFNEGDAFVDRFYTRLFEIYPEVKLLFEKSNMMLMRKKLLQSLILIVGNLSDPSTAGYLMNLGKSHLAQYGVLPKHFPMLGQALLETLGEFLGEGWTPDVEQAWQDAYVQISAQMQHN